jgi:O-antigen ligase
MKIFEKIIEYGFYLYIFFLPWQTRWIWQQGNLNNGQWEYGTFSLYASEILLLLILLFGFIWVIFNRSKVREEKIDLFSFYILIFVLILSSFISTYWAKSETIALYAFIKLMEGMGFFGLVMKINFTFRRAALAMVITAFIQSILAIYQFLSQSVLGNKWLGMSSQIPFQGGVSVIETETGRWLRAYGSLPHPNMLGGFLVVSLLLLIGLAFISKKRIEKIFILIGFIVINVALFLTFSRESWIALVLAISFLFYIILKSQNKELKAILVNLLLVSLTVTGLFSLFFKDELLTRIEATGRLEIKSTEERVSYYDQAYKLIGKNLVDKKDWFKGLGIGSYTLAVHEELDRNLKPWEYQPVHNVYVLMLAELGIEGMAVFLFLIYKILKEVQMHRLITQKEIIISAADLKVSEIILLEKKFDYWFLIFSSILIAIAVISLFDHYFWTLYFGIMLLWFSVGLWLRNFKSTRYNYV